MCFSISLIRKNGTVVPAAMSQNDMIASLQKLGVADLVRKPIEVEVEYRVLWAEVTAVEAAPSFDKNEPIDFKLRAREL